MLYWLENKTALIYYLIPLFIIVNIRSIPRAASGTQRRKTSLPFFVANPPPPAFQHRSRPFMMQIIHHSLPIGTIEGQT